MKNEKTQAETESRRALEIELAQAIIIAKSDAAIKWLSEERAAGRLNK